MKPELMEENLIKTDQSEGDLSSDAYVKRFRLFAKEYFEVELNNIIDPVQKVKETSKLVSFSLPANLSEIFLRAEEAHILWTLDTPLNTYLEDYFKLHYNKGSGIELLRTAKEGYQKWVFNKSQAEKKYFANTFISLADKKFAVNFWLYLLLSSVYLNEKSLINGTKSIEFLEKAKDAVLQSKLTESYRDEVIYLINIYAGIADLKQNNTNSANERFTEALRLNPFSITSKFYLALSEINLNNKEVADHLLKEILNFDYFRCSHAINSNSSAMLHYFILHPVIRNIFYYSDFSVLADSFEAELIEIKRNYNNEYDTLSERLRKLDNLKFAHYYNSETSKIITFITQVLGILGRSKSVIFMRAYKEIEARFSNAIDNITRAIKDHFLDEIRGRLASFNGKIENRLAEIDKIKLEQDGYVQKIKERYKETIDRIENEASAQISEVENKINNINNILRLNPRYSFSRAMTFNFIASILVFMMGGCTGYTDSFVYNVYEFKEVVGIILISGLKWGGISFFSGILVSFIIAGYVIMERASEKQKLVKRISFIKEQKERDLDLLNKDYIATEKSIHNQFLKRINDLNNEIKALAEEKDNQEKRFREEAEQKIEAETKKLEEIA